MMLIRMSLAVLAAAPMALLAICGACCRWMTPPAAALPRPRGEWYPRTLPPLPNTAPLPTAALPCLQETWVREVMAQIEADSAGICEERTH